MACEPCWKSGEIIKLEERIAKLELRVADQPAINDKCVSILETVAEINFKLATAMVALEKKVK